MDLVKNTVFRYGVCFVLILFLIIVDYGINDGSSSYRHIVFNTLFNSLVFGFLTVIFDEYHAYAVFFFDFLATIFFKDLISDSYVMIVDVVVIFMIGYIKDRNVFNYYKSLITSLVFMSSITFILYFFCYGVIMQLFLIWGFEKVLIISLLATVAKSVVVNVLIYIFLKKVPLRKRTYWGRYCKNYDVYTDYYKLRKIMKKKNLTQTMTIFMFVTVSFLTVFAIISSNMLLPSLGNAVNIVNESGHLKNSEFQAINFVYNTSGIVYDIKLFIMIMCLAIPLTSIINRILQKKITEPVSNMSITMNRFVGKKDTAFHRLHIGMPVGFHIYLLP